MLRQRDSVFDAVAHPVRRQLLEAMVGRPAMSITALASAVEVSRSTASRHLVILRRSGLVTAESCDQSALQSIEIGAFAQLFEWLWPLVDTPVGGSPRPSAGGCTCAPAWPCTCVQAG